jgi:choline dehydrogenase-like flavoprotein
MKHRFNKKTYDYIIIGSGAAGSVMAARLGENKNNNILILEAGQDNRLSSRIISEYDKLIESVPIKDGIYLRRYHNNPDKKKCGGLEASPSLSDYVTVKQKERYFAYPRGSGAGGSTGHHSMYDGRGAPFVYDRIAKLMGDDIWSYKNILPYYIKMESYNVPL